MTQSNQDAKNYKIEDYSINEEPFYIPTSDEIKVFESAYNQKVPVLLKGPTGTGKTRFVEYMLSLENPFSHILLAGDGVNRAIEYIKDKPPNLHVTLEEGCGGPQAFDIATLVKAKFKLNQPFPLPRPLYLRQPDVTKQKV